MHDSLRNINILLTYLQCGLDHRLNKMNRGVGQHISYQHTASML